MTITIRQPAVAGAFYPVEKNKLAAEVGRYLAVPGAVPRPARMAVSPHAGYMYSGHVAGAVFAEIAVPERVIVLGPKHRHGGSEAAVSTATHWRFPFGDVPLDHELGRLLVDAAPLEPDERAHSEEHSLEVQVPFLWYRNPKVTLVPIALGMQPLPALERLGEGLAVAIARLGKDVLIVASTDMSHYIPAGEAARLDQLAIARVLALDPPGLLRTVLEHNISMCGVIPTVVALFAAKRLGAQAARLVRYSNSGVVSGEEQAVVGYAGMIVE